MDVGDIHLGAISDGTFVARPGYFGDDATGGDTTVAPGIATARQRHGLTG
jgi:hypothetical protein